MDDFERNAMNGGNDIENNERPMVCPFLPEPLETMSYRDVRAASDADVEAYYFTNLQYGHFLWREGFAGRALLALTRGLYADLPQTALVLEPWPLPYGAIGWSVSKHPSDDFPGNPRISFQHQATRMEGERRDLRRARAWAVWWVICAARPSLAPDLKQEITEPDIELIEKGLCQWGHSNECEVWKAALG